MIFKAIYSVSSNETFCREKNPQKLPDRKKTTKNNEFGSPKDYFRSAINITSLFLFICTKITISIFFFHFLFFFWFASLFISFLIQFLFHFTISFINKSHKTETKKKLFLCGSFVAFELAHKLSHNTSNCFYNNKLSFFYLVLIKFHCFFHSQFCLKFLFI